MRALLILALLAGCTTPPVHLKPAPHYASHVRARPTNATAAEYRRADDAAFAYVASPAADPAVIAGIRTRETAIGGAQGRHNPAATRKAVDGLRTYLAAQGIH